MHSTWRTKAGNLKMCETRDNMANPAREGGGDSESAIALVLTGGVRRPAPFFSGHAQQEEEGQRAGVEEAVED